MIGCLKITCISDGKIELSNLAKQFRQISPSRLVEHFSLIFYRQFYLLISKSDLGFRFIFESHGRKRLICSDKFILL